MKKMNQKDFDALQRKKGIKIKRKMGAQKKPEPEAMVAAAKSGAAETIAPAPASDTLAPVMGRMADILERMETKGKPGALTAAKQSQAKRTEREKEQEQERLKRRELDDQERDLTATRNREARDRELQEQRQHKSVMESLRPKKQILPEFTEPRVVAAPVKERTPWTHNVTRNDLGRMVKVVSSNAFGAQWTHMIERSNDQLIEAIVSTPS